MLSYYDAILAAVPILLTTIPSLLYVGGLGLELSIMIGSAVAMGFIGHALFFNGPTVQSPNDADNESPSQ